MKLTKIGKRKNARLIGEFAGYTNIVDIPFEEFFALPDWRNATYDVPKNNSMRELARPVHVDTFFYHELWDWIMPICKKIEDICYSDTDLGDKAQQFIQEQEDGLFESWNNFFVSTKINRVYNSVVKFIEWYNKQNQ